MNELDQKQIDLIVKALRYTAEYGYENTLCQEEVDEYQAMRALIEQLEEV